MEANEIRNRKGSTDLERQNIIQRWKESGKSKKDFCAENGLNYYTLMSWLTLKKKSKPNPIKQNQTKEGFSEVILPTKNSNTLFARISLGKSSVDLYQPVSADFLRQLLNV